MILLVILYFLLVFGAVGGLIQLICAVYHKMFGRDKDKPTATPFPLRRFK